MRFTSSRRPRAKTVVYALIAITAYLAAFESSAFGEDVSAPAILQWFDGSWRSMDRRAGDVFQAGYGSIWGPPPGRADTGNQSVGYDLFDRFDLGNPGNPTLYGTETGLKTAVSALRRAGIDFFADNISNHDGFKDQTTTGFAAAGGYPGFFLSYPGDPNGDFHAANATGDQNIRVAGLIDIDQTKNYQAIRNPVPGFANNLPAGTTALNGRIANVPNDNNRRFYPDRSLPPIVVDDPANGQTNISVYPFNTANPAAGDPVAENNLGYLQRYAQWMVQAIGVDGFRFDAAKNLDSSVLPRIDRSIFRASTRTLLDGSQKQVFSFSEVYDGNRDLLKSFIRKDINPSTPNVVGGNRDVLDFPQFFALRDNLNQNGIQNDWRNVVSAGMDVYDDGKHNGSAGVLFVASHDDFGADFGNVAYAYTLMQPGNSIVYYNAKEFGPNRSFPKSGRDDALGGLYGDAITTLTQLRNTHGRGNWKQRYLSKELFAFERENSALVLLNNRGDSGYDARNLPTGFAPGATLVELTGNAVDPALNPNGDIPQLLTVKSDGTVDARFLRNRAADGTLHGDGYLIYGLAGPQGSLTISGVSKTIAPQTPTASTNGTARLSAIDVITANSMQVNLSTQAVTLAGTVRDRSADGDTALIKLDEGRDLNNNGHVDHVTPGAVNYGFEEFTTVRSPGYFNANGNGQYAQTIDTTQLAEGYHYVEVRAFRQRSDGGPAIYTPFTRVVYVDRLPPVSAIASFAQNGSLTTTRSAQIRSVDQTADNIHEFLNLPANLTNAQIIAMIGGSTQGAQIDRDLWSKDFTSVPSGNNVITTVTYEISGNLSVQRFAGILTSTSRGRGLGDTNFDNSFAIGDVNDPSTGFEHVLYSQNALFNPAADLNGDGRIDNNDLYALPNSYKSQNAQAAVQTEARNAVLRRGDITGNFAGSANAADIDALYANRGSTSWNYDFDVSGGGANQADVDTLVRTILHSEYGDANLDGQVDTLDFNQLAANIGRSGAGIGWATADFNGDHSTDTVDFNLLAAHFGFQYSASELAAAPVPEPSATTVVCLLLGTLAARRGGKI